MGNAISVSPAEASTGTHPVCPNGSGETTAEHMLKAPAGWYYDPADEAIYRYWDGERWTERLSDTITSEIPRPTS